MNQKPKIKEIMELKNGIDENAILILGVANAGLVGNICADYLIEKLDLKEIAYIRCGNFPPVSVFLEGRLKHPFRIYANQQNGPSKVFVATSEIPLDKKAFHELAHSLVDYVEELKIKKIITLVGVPVQAIDHYTVLFAAGDSYYNKLNGIDHLEPIPKGMVFGLEALVLNETMERDIVGFSLIAPVKKHLPATRSAAELINRLNDIFDFMNVDTSELIERDEKLQNKLSELAQQIKKQQQALSHGGAGSSSPSPELFT
jgi:uncharacterized protein